jgi:hypothetical protein
MSYIYKLRGSNNWSHKPRPRGRPIKKLGVRDLRKVRQLLLSARQPNKAKTPKQIAQELAITVHPRTIVRAIQRMPDARLVAPRRTLKLFPKHLVARAAAAANLQKLSPTSYWSLVTFADKKKFSLSGPRLRSKVWCLRGHEPLAIQHESDRAGCNVWAAINRDGLVGPIWQKQRLTGKTYEDILEETKESLTEAYLDDGATPHCTANVLQWMEKNEIERCHDSLQLPSKFPEANVIEKVWAIVEKKLWQNNPYFASSTHMFTRLQAIFNQMKQTGEDVRLFHKLTARLPHEFAAIHAAKGKQVLGKVAKE